MGGWGSSSKRMGDTGALTYSQNIYYCLAETIFVFLEYVSRVCSQGKTEGYFRYEFKEPVRDMLGLKGLLF